jgi:hypothetical protein
VGWDGSHSFSRVFGSRTNGLDSSRIRNITCGCVVHMVPMNRINHLDLDRHCPFFVGELRHPA